MGREARGEDPNGIYHVFSRGNNRDAIVWDDDDRGAWLRILAHVATKYDWAVYAYCLMTNHFHLLFQIPEEGGLSDGMRLLNGLYSRVTNKRYGRTGHLFHNRFHAMRIETESHLLVACGYIVLNPLRADLCTQPEAWRWSSYRASAGLVTPPKFLAVPRLLGLFDHRQDVAVAAYRRFVGGLVSDTNTRV